MSGGVSCAFVKAEVEVPRTWDEATGLWNVGNSKGNGGGVKGKK